jgi:hypothetical protein
MRPPSRRKRALFVAVLVLIPYLVVESVVSAWAWFAWWDQSFTVIEDTGATFVFDPVRGYRLTETPARMVRMTNGRIEYVGAFRGNNQGFGDRDDFGPLRPGGSGLRLAVFGDSFSHAPYLGQNWPDRAEDLARDQGEPMQLLNFAQWAAGLGNWWSILTKVLDAENYDLDGLVFAVWELDLLRGLTFCATPEPGPQRTLLFGRCRTWDPSSFPVNGEQARAYLDPNTAQYLVPRPEFERTLQGTWPAPAPRPVRPVLFTALYRLMRGHVRPAPAEGAPVEGDFQPGQVRMIEDMKRCLERRHLPALVIYLPSREALLGRSPSSRLHEERTREFARRLGATFVDGGDVFRGMEAGAVRAQFFPHDGHWNQQGSDRFAAWVLPQLGIFKAASGASARRTEARGGRNP